MPFNVVVAPALIAKQLEGNWKAIGTTSKVASKVLLIRDVCEQAVRIRWAQSCGHGPMKVVNKDDAIILMAIVFEFHTEHFTVKQWRPTGKGTATFCGALAPRLVLHITIGGCAFLIW